VTGYETSRRHWSSRDDWEGEVKAEARSQETGQRALIVHGSQEPWKTYFFARRKDEGAALGSEI
jgi:hypothetical protein